MEPALTWTIMMTGVVLIGHTCHYAIGLVCATYQSTIGKQRLFSRIEHEKEIGTLMEKHGHFELSNLHLMEEHEYF